MIPLLQDPPARFTFIVGRGGVGKSTAAAALALAWSGDRSVHLLSTDPAHSLGDVFSHEFLPGVPASVCGSALTVEELDADARGRAWQARARGPLAELLRAGSYLADDEIDLLTGLRLPGSGEVVAALRLVELAEAGAGWVVVDTAPAAHTVRLLDVHRVIDSWTAMLAALAEKRDAVARALAGEVPTSPGDEFRAELEAATRHFRERVIGEAAFLVASRAGVAESDTHWLVQALRNRGLGITVELRMGDVAPRASGQAEAPTLVTVPALAPPPRGCAALREWTERLGEPGRAGELIAVSRPGAGTGELWLRGCHQRLLLFVGKGGVGKSTCAAAAAVALAESRPVLLLGADPAGAVPELLGITCAGEPVPAGPGLRAVQIDPAAALASWHAALPPQLDPLLGRIGLGGDTVLDRAVLRSVWEATPPGLDELVALAELLELADEAETVVLDTAPTGHLLRLLELPDLALEWTRALMRLLLEYGLAGELDALTERVLRFARQLKTLRSRLADAGWTGAVIVTVAEPVIEAETRRLADRLVQAGVPVAAVLTNFRAERTVALPLSAPHLAAPVSARPPRGLAALRQFTASWELA